MRALYRQGCAHQAATRHAEAARAFSAALAAAPDFADAAQNLGCCLFALRRFDDAAQACAQVVRLRPDAGAYYNLGMALVAAGKPAEAVGPLRSAATLAPGQARHHRALGLALAAADRKAEAVPALAAALRQHPVDADLLTLMAGLLIDEGRLEAAAGAAVQAVERAPQCGHAQSNLARALHGLGRSAAALTPARAAARLHPADGGAAATLAAVLYTLGEHAEALELSQRALILAPRLFQAKANEALALEALGRLQEAEAAGRAAVALAPDSAETRHNLAAMLLAAGRMTAEAWALYEARLELNPAARAIAAIPRWRGEDVAGKTVLLHCEQGFGDTIQFARYVPLVAGRGARVVLAVQPELVRLLQATPGADAVVDATGVLPPYDVFCPLLSLPGVFGATLDTIPPPVPLAFHPGPARPGLQVGLAWAGSAAFIHDGARSAGLAALAPLAGVAGVTFHSLQRPAQDLNGFPMLDRMADMADFADTAAVIAGLDLVICVDTAIAHLAATMGKEVWLLSRHMGCWRWLRDREDSPWYPTLRIYRQERPNDWASVVERLREDLARRVANRPPIAAMARPRTALDGMVLPPGAPRTVVALLGENENGILRSLCRGFMDLLPPYGLAGHIVDMRAPGWEAELAGHVERGLLFAWGSAGVGARMPKGDGLLWDAAGVPFISVMSDSPCIMPANHAVPSRWVANGYIHRDWLDVQRRLIRSPQISALLPIGTLANPGAATRWADRAHRMLLVKTGRDPALHRAEWTALPRRFRAVLEEASAAALQAGVGDIAATVLRCLEEHDLFLDGRTDLLFGLMQRVDGYVRDHRSTDLVRALLDLPVDIVGRGWDHAAHPRSRARFHPAADAASLPALYADTQFLLNTMPNVSYSTHERVLSGFAAGAAVVTNENADMRARFGALPSYLPIDTAAPGLCARLAELFHSPAVPDTAPALALVAAEFSGEGFMRGLIDLALEVAATPDFAPWRFSCASSGPGGPDSAAWPAIP